jgi:translation initiation factor 1A
MAQDKNQQTEEIRVRLPRGREVLGIVTQRLGGSRTNVACLDGKTRICRIPGRLKKSLWLREGDVVLVEPWEYSNDKGDIIWKYTKTQANYLKSKGYLKNLSELEEF